MVSIEGIRASLCHQPGKSEFSAKSHRDEILGRTSVLRRGCCTNEVESCYWPYSRNYDKIHRDAVHGASGIHKMIRKRTAWAMRDCELREDKHEIKLPQHKILYKSWTGAYRLGCYERMETAARSVTRPRSSRLVFTYRKS